MSDATRKVKTPCALSIAGSDSSAGAGLQADLKTFSALGVFGATVVTAVTAQNTRGVTAIHQIPGDVIEAQIDAVFDDLSIKAVKIGMLGDERAVLATARALSRRAASLPLIVDPVMVATSGSRLLAPEAEAALVARLIPVAALITPNMLEVAALLSEPTAQSEADAEAQAKKLLQLGCAAVLLKGGHGSGAEAVDIFADGETLRKFRSPRLPTRNTHGTGCTLASAITAYLVHELPLIEAIEQAKAYLQGALAHADEMRIGEGPGPVAHFWRGVNSTC